jgi:hypothetical protein
LRRHFIEATDEKKKAERSFGGMNENLQLQGQSVKLIWKENLSLKL